MRQVTCFRDPSFGHKSFASTKRANPARFFLEVLRRLSGQMRGCRARDLRHKGKCPTISSVCFPLHQDFGIFRRKLAGILSPSTAFQQLLLRRLPPPPPPPPSQTPELSRSSQFTQLVVGEPLSQSVRVFSPP